MGLVPLTLLCLERGCAVVSCKTFTTHLYLLIMFYSATSMTCSAVPTISTSQLLLCRSTRRYRAIFLSVRGQRVQVNPLGVFWVTLVFCMLLLFGVCEMCAFGMVFG